MAIRRADGVERVYDRLRSMAMGFGFEPGQKVKEGALAAEFGVSRTPVREALNRLVSEGFMSFVPNRGFFCRDIDLDEIAELYQIRAALEGWAFRAACAQVQDGELARFCEVWGDPARPGAFATLDLYDAGFHAALAGLCGNALLARQLGEIGDKIGVFRNLELEDLRRREKTLSEHQGIVEALARREAEAGAALLERHIVESAANALAAARARLERARAG